MIALILCALVAIQDDAAAATALETFSKAWLRDKAGDARAAAVTELAKTIHEKVASKLVSLLTSEDKQIKVAAAAGLGTFNTAPELKKSAAKGLASALTAGANSSDSDAKVAILAAIGALQEESVAGKVRDTLEDKDNKVASAAVTAAGQLKSKSLVEPLIDILKEIDALNKKASAASGASAASKLGAQPKKGAPAGADPDRVKKDRANALYAPVQAALAALTGETYRTGEEYEKWWSKNKGTFTPK